MSVDSSALRPVDRSRLYEDLVDRLGEFVIRTNLTPGARFPPERELASRLGVSVMTVAHRHGRSDRKPQTAIIESWDRWRGAYASSYSHDSHNLVAYGHDPAEMALAANTVIAMGGGIAVVKDGGVLARIAYPVAGLLSDKSPAEVAHEHRSVVEAAGRICTWQPPYRTFKALAGQSLACNPGPHLTDQGLTDGTTKEIRDVLVGPA